MLSKRVLSTEISQVGSPEGSIVQTKQANTYLRGVAVAICAALILVPAVISTPVWGIDNCVSPEEARGEAQGLIDRVWSLTVEDPGRPSAQSNWWGARAGEPLLIYEFSRMEPVFYLTPVINPAGEVVSLVSVDANSGEWTWYSESYPLPHFPLVDVAEAEEQAEKLLRKWGLAFSLPPPLAVTGPDGLFYWVWDISAMGTYLKRVYKPMFDQGRVYTDLEAPPWDIRRELVVPELQDGGSQGGSGGFVSIPGRVRGGSVPSSYDISGVPYHQQETSYWCGMASLEMVMDYYGPDISQAEIAKVANAVSPDGCTDTDLLRASQFSSLSAAVQDPNLHGYTGRSWGYGGCSNEWTDNDYDNRYERLKWLISQNYPVVVLQWSDQAHNGGHFRVVKGYDDGAGVFIVHDPWQTEGPNIRFDQSVFVDDLWVYSDRWGMISPPWSVSLGVPSEVQPGETFTATAQVEYLGPTPFEGQFEVSGSQVTIGLPTGYSLVSGSATQALPEITSAGSSGLVSWEVWVDSTASSSPLDIGLEARGTMEGDPTASYPDGYQDLIGGNKSWTEVEDGRTFYFAEGTTRPGYEEWLCIQNASSGEALVEITYMLDGGENHVQSVVVAGQSRVTVSVNKFIAQNATSPYRDVSARVQATNGADIIVERPMYFNVNGISGGHDVLGTTALRTTWYFAEGNTYDWNEEWLCIQNPGDNAANVQVRYLTLDSGIITQGLIVNPRSRHTENVNAFLSPLKTDVAMVVESDQPIVAERPMYFTYQGGITGGSDVMGAASPSTQWLFAEGTTRWWADEWICVQNPNDQAVNLEVTYMPEGKPDFKVPYAVEGKGRLTINVNEGAGDEMDLSLLIESDLPLVSERAMYFTYGVDMGLNWTGGHASVGAVASNTSWDFAEGCTRYGQEVSFQEWICVQNPNDSAVGIDVTYFLSNGDTVGSAYVIPENSRWTIDVASDVGLGKDVSANVVGDLPIICERPMYFNLRGAVGGHDAMGYTQ